MERYADVIDKRLWRGTQGLQGTLIVRVVDTVLRAKIDRDHYEHQSSAVVQAWSGTKWEEVATLPIRDLGIFRYTVESQDWEPQMERSLRKLIKLAVFVLFKQATSVEFEEAPLVARGAPR
jgi:hypothetical protein